jgi:3-oxoacyl-[acyl-carrier-protein] synthase II
MREVVITAASVISPLGSSIPEFESGLFGGASGTASAAEGLGLKSFPVPHAAFLKGVNLPELERLDYAGESLAMRRHLLAGLQESGLPDRIDGVVFGSNDCGPRVGDWLAFSSRSAEDVITGFGSGAMGDSLHAQLREISVVVPRERIVPCFHTCVTGLVSLGQAADRIRAGEWTAALVGANELRIRPWILMSYQLLGVLSTAPVPSSTASRPFSASRSGFVKAEGGGMILVEERAAAERRGAKILARVEGWGFTSDAYRLTDGREDAAPAAEAMREALRSSGLEAGDIDYLNAHGSGTRMNDKNEVRAIRSVFGADTHLPVSSTKSQIGHSNVACGIVELIACVSMLRKQAIAPTINLQDPDPDLGLDFVPGGSREARIRKVLKNSFGFGGLNASIVLSAC